MWKILTIFAVLYFGGADADASSDLIGELIEQQFRGLCLKYANIPTFDRVMAGYHTMEKCTGEESLMETIKDTHITTKSRTQWDGIYTSMCAQLDNKRKCAEDFNKIIIECMSTTEFLRLAITGNATIDFWQNVCRNEKSNVLDFIMNNGVLCLEESNRQMTACIEKKRTKMTNVVSKEEAATIAAKCFNLHACSEKQIKELERRNTMKQYSTI